MTTIRVVRWRLRLQICTRSFQRRIAQFGADRGEDSEQWRRAACGSGERAHWSVEEKEVARSD